MKGSHLILDAISNLKESISNKEQDDKFATKANKITKDEYNNWNDK